MFIEKSFIFGSLSHPVILTCGTTYQWWRNCLQLQEMKNGEGGTFFSGTICIVGGTDIELHVCAPFYVG